MDVEEDEEGEEEEEGEEKEEDEQEEGGSIHRPQQAELSGKRSYLQSINSLCKWFSSDIGDLVIKVSGFVVWSHLQDHILSLSPVAEPHVVLPLLEDEALPGNVVQVHHGPYAGQTGIIKWISPDSKVWMFNCGRGKGKEDSEQDSTPSQSMVAMNTSDLCIKRVPSTLTLSKDKGYNIAVGDMVEVARGQWCHSQGIVKAVDLIKASLDFMCLEDGIQINVPITFSHKVKEHFDYGLSKFIGHDVWVIGGDKKGT
ncbi:hypothetical protein EDD17DRAFT_1750078 [Pisolithus thermaeus]|nr:hypothetical protein EDD17DRAFT_1750078 [Pisolithus thermaeus]